jgi:hypothetical protein
LTTAELVVFNASRSRVEISSTQLIHPLSKTTAESEEDQGLQTWAQSAISRLAADSPAASIRVRSLLMIGDQVGVETRFRFLPVSITGTESELNRRAVAMRTTPDRIRYPQGQFGGTELPLGMMLAAAEPAPDFELAPPLVRGVQPLRLLERPKTIDAPPTPAPWPWGLSGIRYSTVYRERAGTDAAGTVAEVGQMRVWWHSPAFRVQFSVPRDRQLLPPGYRARAVPGFLPVWFAAPLPTKKQFATALAIAESGTLDGWAAVLPSHRRVVTTGLRSGAPYAFRESLTTQDLARPTGASLVSVSVPVQHRAPRPVLLPASVLNGHEFALQTWGSWFDLTLDQTRQRTIAVSHSPTAEFTRIRSGATTGLRVVVVAPTKAEIEGTPLSANDKKQFTADAGRSSQHGELPRNWDGRLFVQNKTLISGVPPATWPKHVSL